MRILAKVMTMLLGMVPFGHGWTDGRILGCKDGSMGEDDARVGCDLCIGGNWWIKSG